MHKIGIISDTHGLLRQEVVELLQSCDVILHGGDINRQDILDTLGKIAPTYAVRGNNDKAWADLLPESLSLELFGVHFFMVHHKKAVPKNMEGIDVVIYGHSHQYAEQHIGGQLWLNPGSCGPKRFYLPVTMAVMHITEKKEICIEKIELSQQVCKQSQTDGDITNRLARHVGANEPMQMERNELPRNLKKVIHAVIKDTDRGIAVNEIAVRNGIRKDLAEQICRLYLTHPGVTAEGIMGKMGL